MNYAFDYLKTKSFCQLAQYPYTATQGVICKSSSCTGVGVDKTTVAVAKNEGAHLTALASGPVSIAVDATYWYLYQYGIITSCGPVTGVNHGVVLVGYTGATSTLPAYWKVRNSWSSTWGEAGYIRLQVGGNLCLLTTLSSYPTF